MSRLQRVLLAAAAVSAALARAPLARADEHSIIRDPGDHPSYVFEAEPHLLLGFAGPFEGREAGPGVGFRGTFHIADGFIKSINDTVGVGFGIDIVPTSPETRVLVPIVLQWNFWLSTHWSVFGEPGVAIASAGPWSPFDPFIFYVGGRYHFTERIALTMRIGYPDASVGASFLF
jgi:hypothetical protein